MLSRRRTNIEVADGAAERIPADDRSIDAIWAVNTMHHWVDDRARCTEIARVLRPNGRAPPRRRGVHRPVAPRPPTIRNRSRQRAPRLHDGRRRNRWADLLRCRRTHRRRRIEPPHRRPTGYQRRRPRRRQPSSDGFRVTPRAGVPGHPSTRRDGVLGGGHDGSTLRSRRRARSTPRASAAQLLDTKPRRTARNEVVEATGAGFLALRTYDEVGRRPLIRRCLRHEPHPSLGVSAKPRLLVGRQLRW